MILINLLILSKAFKLYVGLLQKVFDPSVSVFDEAGALLLLLDQLLLFFGQHYLNFFEITGEAIQIPASTQPKFKAGKGLKDAVNA